MEQQVQQQAVISKPLLTVSFCLFQKEQDATQQVELEKKHSYGKQSCSAVHLVSHRVRRTNPAVETILQLVITLNRKEIKIGIGRYKSSLTVFYRKSILHVQFQDYEDIKI